jgi:tartrate dehydratase alpha subunit/fumarate hydratase class I-like protein
MSELEDKRAARLQAFQRAQAVKRAHEEELLQKPNVVGVGVGLRQLGGEITDTVAVVVMVRRKHPRAKLVTEDLIPVEIEGVPVDVQEIGEIQALS